MGHVLIERVNGAKALAVKIAGTQSPFKKSELAEAFLLVLVDIVAELADREAKREDVKNGE